MSEFPPFHKTNLYVWDDPDWVPMTQPAGGGGPSLPVSLANGGTGTVMVDPNVDKIMFWDDSASQMKFLTLGPNLVITGTTINVIGSFPAEVFVTRETPTGAIDGVNAVYTLAATPTAGSETVYLNGILQNLGGGNDYTIAGAVITFNIPPEITTASLLVSYRA